MRGITCIVDTLIQITKIFFLISFAMFCPRLFLFYSVRGPEYNPKNSTFKLGVENIQPESHNLFTRADKKDARIAVIVNDASVDQSGSRTIDVLLKKNIKIKKIIFPDEKEKNNSEKELSKIGLEFYNLYTKSRKIDNALFNDIDVIIFDVPDISVSYAKYIKIIQDTLWQAHTLKKRVVILDRPNLSGAKIEGTVAEQLDKHFGLPLRSGMTTGEIARYINKNILNAHVDLHVIPMDNYVRSYDGQRELLEHLVHIQLPTCSSSGYSFLGLLSQVAPFDVGIGTDWAFECLLLPESVSFETQKWYELQVNLRKIGIDSRFCRYFYPLKKEYYSGLHFNMQSMRDVATFNTLLSVLTFFKNNGLGLSFSACFDRTVGTSLVREVVQGVRSHELLKEKVNTDLQIFFKSARDSFIYQPLPELVFI